MSRLVDYARSEYKLAFPEKEEMQSHMLDNLVSVLELIGKQGHSGVSMNYFLNHLNRLIDFKPLTPLTGEEDEWEKTREDAYQNKRCSAVFKDEKGNARYIEAKVFSEDGGKTWYTCRESSVPIEFPFTVPAKPEYILVEKNQRRRVTND